MNGNTIRAALSICLLSPTLTAAQEPAIYRPTSRVACGAASGLVDLAGNIVPGAVRKRCDTVWFDARQNGEVGRWRYKDFISQCARSCAAPRTLTRASSVTRDDAFGTHAAQSASGGARAGVGLNTVLLVVDGMATAADIGVMVSHGSPGPKDPPASP